MPAGFEMGALYNRVREIHEVFGGQRQGGISTPGGSDFIFLFTGEAGKAHGYDDFVDEEGFHLYGEGQGGDMEFVRGNLAIQDHEKNGKRLLLFQSLGKGRPYRFLGEQHLIRTYAVETRTTSGDSTRSAIVFVLARNEADALVAEEQAFEVQAWRNLTLEGTSTHAVREVRVKQALFRDNLLRVERRCRLTGVEDLRFLRASHIKPWSRCESGAERVDGNNGLLLAPHADHLFDQGWISFENNGSLILSPELPSGVLVALGLAATVPKSRPFNEAQRSFLRFHRGNVLRL